MNPYTQANKKILALKSEKPSRSLSSSSLQKSQQPGKYGAASNPKMLMERTRSFAMELIAGKSNTTNDSASGGGENAVSQSRMDSLLATAKRNSETKIHFKLASEDNLTRDSSFIKDLPMTDAFQTLVKAIDVNEFKTDVISMARNAYEKASTVEMKDNSLFYDFLTSHGLKVLQFLTKAGFPVNEIKLEWKALTRSNSKDLALAINVWAAIQEKYMDFIMNREKKHLTLLEEFEDLEERNLLLQDFLSQKTSYSTSSTIEIQVKQVVKEPSLPKLSVNENPVPAAPATEVSHPITDPLVSIDESQIGETSQVISKPLDQQMKVETGDSIISSPATDEYQQVLAEIPSFLGKPKFKARRLTRAKMNVEVQTIPVYFGSDKPYVDLMDRATGPDREIPVYHGVGCQADFRHPVEDLYENVVVQYQYLQQEHAKEKIQSVAVVEELKSDFKIKIETQTNDSKAEITKLESRIAELNQENERLERDLSDSNSVTAVQKAELLAVKEKISQVSQQLENVTQIEEFQRKTRIETETLLQAAKEEISVISKAVQDAAETNTKLLEQKTELEVKQEEASKSLRILEEALVKTETSFHEAKRAESKLQDVAAELKKEQDRKEELIALTETLQAENECVKEIEDRLNQKNSDLEKIIAKLMEFPDLSLGSDFQLTNPPNSPEFTSTLHHMVEHNNLRISLLEQRNKRFRDVLLNQAKELGSEQYSNYHPISSTTVIFNMNAIDFKSRPTSAESSKTLAAGIPPLATTYILGQGTRSRPVSAVSIRLLRPSSSKKMVDQAAETPILSKLLQQNNSGERIYNDEGPRTKFPPTRFPFLSTSNPLSIYDSSLMEDAPAPCGLSQESKPKPPRSALKGSRPTTAKSRPNSASSEQPHKDFSRQRFEPTKEMGGGHGSPTTLPKIWSWYGGYNPNPIHYVRNSVITGAFILTCTAIAFNFSSNLERRVRYPDRWIPSMLWAKEFHDPKSVEMWKKQLKSEGREWIEPIPDWCNLGHMASHFFRNCVYKELDKRDQSESLIVKSSNDNSQPSLSVTLIVKEIEDAELPTPFSSRVLQSFSQQLCPSLRDSSIKGVLQVETSSISQECLQFIEVSDKTLVTAYFLNPKEVWIKSQILHESNEASCAVRFKLIFPTEQEGNTASLILSRVGISIKRLVKLSASVVSPLDSLLSAAELDHGRSPAPILINSTETSQSQVFSLEEVSEERAQMTPMDLEAWFGGGRERDTRNWEEMEWNDAVDFEKNRMSIRVDDHSNDDQCCEIPLFFDLDQISNKDLLRWIQSASPQVKASVLPSSMQVWVEKASAMFS